jgi:hypothetical protein
VLDGIGLGGSDDLELLRLARLLVLHVDHGADADGLGVHVLLVDQRGAAKLVLELGDPLLEHRLLVLGVVVLGVLHDVAELPRRLDPVGDLTALVALEEVQLLPELLESLGGDQCLAGHALLDSSAVGPSFPPSGKCLLDGEKEPAPAPKMLATGRAKRASIAPRIDRVERLVQASRARWSAAFKDAGSSICG